MWLFQQLTYADVVANNAMLIDNFPQRIERFLDCISQVYFEQESLNAVVTGSDKTVGKKLMCSYETEMAATARDAAAGSHARPSMELEDVDN